jgi:cytochrome c oxidase subunit IV
MSAHIVSVRSYLGVFTALMALTALTIFVATIDLGPLNIVVALLVAAVKASLVVVIFMHARFGGRLVVLTIFAGILFLAILIGLTLTDYLTRGWLPGPPGF